ncbi:YecA family protein [Pseudomonas plecoglossicida]|uniref:YecA family protein n=1 Tax=Pseudomonas plecoglossicida TaxID=70775 RepID=UPI003D245103
MSKPVIRTESEVFADLVELAASPGYVYAIAFICHRDNLVVYLGELSPDNMAPLFSSERLMRTEITTLLGLMVRKTLDLKVPTVEALSGLVARTDALMLELHHALSHPMFSAMREQAMGGSDKEAAWDGMSMREPIFYGTESAYSFQYRDLLPAKYGADDSWLIEKMGFSISQAQLVARTMCSLMDERSSAAFSSSKMPKVDPHLLLEAFEYSAELVANSSGLDLKVVEAVFRALTLNDGNLQFQALGDFNAVAATPLLPTARGTVLVFQHYALYEALYESPFFWMWADKPYRPKAMKNRGAFAEQFAAERLTAVFGKVNVHPNVNFYKGEDKDVAGEADVLVAFGDRVIVVQAKSKKLTLEARKGNDGKLKSDFAAAIQDSYDQGWSCANIIVGGGYRLEDDQGKEVKLPATVKEIYLFNMVSEHYPALAFQSSQYLNYQTTDVIKAPFVMDVFLLDTIAEMLTSPLRFLNYIRLRIASAGKVGLSHELTALGCHLKQNVWLEDEVSYVSIDDSYAIDLDTAMTVRREGHPGECTPKGILTKLIGTRYEQVISQIEAEASPATLELGFQLLAMNEDAAFNVHRGLEAITRMTREDGRGHDFTISAEGSSAGVCFHSNIEASPEAMQRLQYHCHKRKYLQQSDTWFGLAVGGNCDIQFGVALEFPWKESEVMNELTKGAQAPEPISSLKSLIQQAHDRKVGRNDPCPCRSGKKYKKCCML